MERKSDALILEEPCESELPLTDIDNKLSKKKKIIISIVSSIVLLLIVILIILYFTLSNDSDDNKENQKQITGIISCIYDIDSNEYETKILSDEFTKDSDFDIYINETKIEYSKKYKFEKKGLTKVEFKLYNSLNMNYMFKDISSLKTIEMISLNNESIISMISTFENSVNLESFYSTGFNFNEIKSFHKLFYNTNLSNFTLVNTPTPNLEDIYLRIVKI